jgi:hypothetical protein
MEEIIKAKTLCENYFNNKLTKQEWRELAKIVGIDVNSIKSSHIKAKLDDINKNYETTISIKKKDNITGKK